MMHISCSTHANDNSATVQLNGHFDMAAHTPFRQAYRQALSDSTLRILTLDLTSVDYIDSSALGMLLLQGEATKQGVRVDLANCRPFVLRVLTMANFHKLFRVG